jgi:hypothetical protein
MDDLLKLADKCVAATTADRKLDYLIYQATDATARECWPHWDEHQREMICPLFTASIDAASRLIPENFSFELSRSDAPAPSGDLKFTRCRLWDWRRGPLAIDPDNEWKSEGNRPLPLNICAAALRARVGSVSTPEVKP